VPDTRPREAHRGSTRHRPTPNTRSPVHCLPTLTLQCIETKTSICFCIVKVGQYRSALDFAPTIKIIRHSNVWNCLRAHESACPNPLCNLRWHHQKIEFSWLTTALAKGTSCKAFPRFSSHLAPVTRSCSSRKRWVWKNGSMAGSTLSRRMMVCELLRRCCGH
jgi:hypothetical protein